MNLENAKLPESVTPDFLTIIQNIINKRKISEEILLDIIQFRFEKIISGDGCKEIPTCVLYYNEMVKELQVFVKKKIVNKVENKASELSLEYFQQILSPFENFDIENGTVIETKFDLSLFTRTDIAVFRFFLELNIRQEQQNLIYRDYMFRVDKIITGVVKNTSDDIVIINLGKIDGIIHPKDQVKREKFKLGEKVTALIISAKDPIPLESDRKLFERKYKVSDYQITLSRASVKFVAKLFEQQVPEISEQIVFIERMIRVAGYRTKIAVRSKDLDVDPVGACIGNKGTRIQNVIHELRGEKVDIIPFERDQVRFVSNSLSPARVNCAYANPRMGIMEVNVPDNQFSLAIGRKGQNVCLASGLTGWQITIKQESEILKEKKKLKALFKCFLCLNPKNIEVLYESYYRDFKNMLFIKCNSLSEMLDINFSQAKKVKYNVLEFFYSTKLRKNSFLNWQLNSMLNFCFISQFGFSKSIINLFSKFFYFTLKDVLLDSPDSISRHLNISIVIAENIKRLIAKKVKVFNDN